MRRYGKFISLLWVLAAGFSVAQAYADKGSVPLDADTYVIFDSEKRTLAIFGNNLKLIRGDKYEENDTIIYATDVEEDKFTINGQTLSFEELINLSNLEKLEKLTKENLSPRRSQYLKELDCVKKREGFKVRSLGERQLLILDNIHIFFQPGSRSLVIFGDDLIFEQGERIIRGDKITVVVEASDFTINGRVWSLEKLERVSRDIEELEGLKRDQSPRRMERHEDYKGYEKTMLDFKARPRSPSVRKGSPSIVSADAK